MSIIEFANELFFDFLRPDFLLNPIEMRKYRSIKSRSGSTACSPESRDTYHSDRRGRDHEKRIASVTWTIVRSSGRILIHRAYCSLVKSYRGFLHHLSAFIQWHQAADTFLFRYFLKTIFFNSFRPFLNLNSSESI